MQQSMQYVGADTIQQTVENPAFGQLHIEFTALDASCFLTDEDAARIKQKVVNFMHVNIRDHIQGEEVNTTTLAEAAAEEFELQWQAPRRGDFMYPEQLSDWAFDVAEKTEPFLRHEPLEVPDDTSEEVLSDEDTEEGE